MNTDISHQLNALSPLDGRYATHTQALRSYFSEAALIQYRAKVEIEYLIALMQGDLPALHTNDAEFIASLRSIYQNFNIEDAAEVKDKERITNHDIKALEYVLREKIAAFKLPEGIDSQLLLEHIHFGLTSQDINNTAIPLMLQDAVSEVYMPLIKKLSTLLEQHTSAWADIAMLAHTHGQPASPTTLGKEIMVFIDRLQLQLTDLSRMPYPAKFGGATGSMNAHKVAYPDVDWVRFANTFVEENLGLSRSRITTQIDHYDRLAAIFDCMRRVNVILLDLARDVWAYISMNYLTQKVVADEVGSSAMPHKVNPIDFENAEGNLGIANALFDHLSNKLPVSRLQRDLTDSTVLRNIGVPLGHTVLAMNSLIKGLNKIAPNPENIQIALDNNVAVLAEAIQTILRARGYPAPYEALKKLTRTGDKLNTELIHSFINSLEVEQEVKDMLLKLRVEDYIGYASDIHTK